MEVNSEIFNSFFQRGIVAPELSEIENFLSEDTNKMFSRQELLNRISGYFDKCLETVIDESSGGVTQIWRRPPTKTGFCASLGIDNKSLQRYLNDDYVNNLCGARQGKIAQEDIPIVRKAVHIIGEYYESRLLTQPAGAIFWLKNANCDEWLDDGRLKIVDERKQTNDSLTRPKLTPEQIAQRYASAELPEKPDFDFD